MRNAVLELASVIDLKKYPFGDETFIEFCRQKLASDAVLSLPGFLTIQAIHTLISEAKENYDNAFHTKTSHNVYLTEPNPTFGDDHIYNRQIISSKGCITTDQIPSKSILKLIYYSAIFRQFAASVLGEKSLFEYADPLSSINVHYADEGKELGWHFDNSTFAITLLLQAPEGGGAFEYVKNIRDTKGSNMNFSGVADVVEGRKKPTRLNIEPGTLVLFRGHNSIHRVTPTIGKKTRILVVLAYNQEPGVALSDAARMTFFGRLF